MRGGFDHTAATDTAPVDTGMLPGYVKVFTQVTIDDIFTGDEYHVKMKDFGRSVERVLLAMPAITFVDKEQYMRYVAQHIRDVVKMFFGNNSGIATSVLEALAIEGYIVSADQEYLGVQTYAYGQWHKIVLLNDEFLKRAHGAFIYQAIIKLRDRLKDSLYGDN